MGENDIEANIAEAARVADTEVITVTLTEAEGVSEIAAPAPAEAAGYLGLLYDVDLTVGVGEAYGNGRRLPHGISGVEFVGSHQDAPAPSHPFSPLLVEARERRDLRYSQRARCENSRSAARADGTLA